ncbi:MAG: hypothetical protein GQ559_04765 [Desulfobulbaceae bacterium]|nr:hypothetical protein [Desulfobulbaceae bacterium]
MTKKHPDISCHQLREIKKFCHLNKGRQQKGAHPLSKSCCNGRVKVCKISGDRTVCARMASLGVLPGSELELLCPAHGRQCMVKVNGGTISLDEPVAENIFVTPV